jgi:hypothetical protein
MIRLEWARKGVVNVLTVMVQLVVSVIFSL